MASEMVRRCCIFQALPFLLKQTESLDTFVENKKQRLEDPSASCLLPPCISPIPNHRLTSTKE